MEIKKDNNDIWIIPKCLSDSYPSDGSKDSLTIEDSSFWFNHRNSVLIKVIERYTINGDFLDVRGGNGYQIQIISKLNNNVLFEPSFSDCLNAKKKGLMKYIVCF